MGSPRALQTILDPGGLATGSNPGQRFDQLTKFLPKTPEQWWKNAESAGQTFFKDQSLRWKGDFSNMQGSSNNLLFAAAGVDPEQRKELFGETTSQMRERTALAKERDDAANAAGLDAETKRNASFRQVSNFLSGMVDSRKRAPGRSQSLLAGSGPKGNNSLLTLVNGK